MGDELKFESLCDDGLEEEGEWSRWSMGGRAGFGENGQLRNGINCLALGIDYPTKAPAWPRRRCSFLFVLLLIVDLLSMGLGVAMMASSSAPVVTLRTVQPLVPVADRRSPRPG